ncbi:MAG: 6-phosphogluconolactonase [Candidatus Limnocylindria bacterium]
MNVSVLPDPGAVAQAGADRFVDAARRAVDERGTFRVALSGGSMPRAMYPLLVASPRVGRVAWDRVEFFWSDERSVPPDDRHSNFGTAYKLLIAHLPGVRPGAVHRMPAEAEDIHTAAAAYEADIRLAFGVRGSDIPVFDQIWLGMGEDGHTASLFPRTEGVDVIDRIVIANWAPTQEVWRMTMTFPVLNAAREAVFLVAGTEKGSALADVMAGTSDLPAARVQAARTEWIVDAAAAGGLAAT